MAVASARWRTHAPAPTSWARPRPDDFTALPACGPDALLVETPHQAHDAIVPWALERGYDLLLGANLAASVASGERFVRLAATHGRVVECGFDRRYDPAWERLRDLIRGGALGQPIQAFRAPLSRRSRPAGTTTKAPAAHAPDPHDVRRTQLHPLDPRPSHRCRGVASRVVETAPQRVSESCSALVRFDGGAFATVVAGYAGRRACPIRRCASSARGGAPSPTRRPAPSRSTAFGGEPEVLSFPRQPSRRCVKPRLPRRHRTANGAAQPPEDALWDVRLAEAIARKPRAAIPRALSRTSFAYRAWASWTGSPSPWTAARSRMGPGRRGATRPRQTWALSGDPVTAQVPFVEFEAEPGPVAQPDAPRSAPKSCHSRV